MDATVAHMPVSGWYTSAESLTRSSFGSPPATSTLPSARRVALCPARRSCMAGVKVKALVAGSYTAALSSTQSAEGQGPDWWLPPATSTLPSPMSVAVAKAPKPGVPAGDQEPAAGSYTSAVSTKPAAARPPTTSTLPPVMMALAKAERAWSMLAAGTQAPPEPAAPAGTVNAVTAAMAAMAETATRTIPSRLAGRAERNDIDRLRRTSADTGALPVRLDIHTTALPPSPPKVTAWTAPGGCPKGAHRGPVEVEGQAKIGPVCL